MTAALLPPAASPLPSAAPVRPAAPADSLHQWQQLLSHVLARLQSSADTCACSHDGTSAIAPDLHGQLLRCLAALTRLQPLLDREFVRLRHMEHVALTAQAALVLARTELASTQDGERRARHLALHDALTALPNRRFFVERLEHATIYLENHGKPQLAVIYMDLDGFKPVNDTYGHDIGDELLKVVAQRLKRRVRSEDMVSRLGGDEFACLRYGHVGHAALAQLARKLYDSIAAPVQIGTLCLRVRPSIGIAIHPADGSTAKALMRSADSAMYTAKRRKMGHAFFAQSAAPQIMQPE